MLSKGSVQVGFWSHIMVALRGEAERANGRRSGSGEGRGHSSIGIVWRASLERNKINLGLETCTSEKREGGRVGESGSGWDGIGIETAPVRECVDF